MLDRVLPSIPNRQLTRVLIVDDVLDVRRELSLLLQLTGQVKVVGEAADGAEAITESEKLNPDAVVLDLEMPTMDGFQAAREIKRRCPHCRLVALSVHSGETERQMAADAGMDVFLVKGAPMQALLKAIGATAGDEGTQTGDSASTVG